MRTEGGWLSFERILSDASTRLTDYAQHRWNPEALRTWVSEASREFARRSRTVHGESKWPLIPGQNEYLLPAHAHQVELVSMLYPDTTQVMELEATQQEELLDGLRLQLTGRPQAWALDTSRRKLILYPKPDLGGYLGRTTSDGNVGGTTVIGSSAGQTDDFYVGQTLRLLDGDLQGAEGAISAYDSATGTFTVAALGGQVTSGTRFAVGPDALRVSYLVHGNTYRIGPTTAAVKDGSLAESVVLDLPQRPAGFYDGCEVEFKSGTLQGERARILSTAWDGTNTVCVLWPELVGAPATADAVVVTEVPNIPEAYHHYLIYFVVATALRSLGKLNEASLEMQVFERGVEDALAIESDDQEREFQQISEYRRENRMGWY